MTLCDRCDKYPCGDNAIKLMKYCPAYSPKPKPQTNADRVRSMTDEELAETFDLLTRTKPDSKDDKQSWLDWLKQEVKE